jgi:hypothetical protein
MLKYLKFKNDEFIKQNGTDFYVLSLFSYNILQKDKLRIEEYKNFKKNTIRFNPLNIITNIGISIALIYQFKSLLIIPFFYTNYYILNWIFPAYELPCYFCERNTKKKEKLENYENMYRLIEYIFERNHNIKNITDFEKELDNLINELNI